MKITIPPNIDIIALQEMKKVRLMNRVDIKYYFHLKHLPQILNQLKKDYYVLEIEKATILPYKTVYFDTIDKQLYLQHHNNKLNRVKIRRRTYASTNTSFFEVKLKTNKGRTLKQRIAVQGSEPQLSAKEQHFINANTAITEPLTISLINKFKRVTFVSKNLNERCTIDFNINFENEEATSTLGNLIIVEIKVDGKKSNSKIATILKDKKIKPNSFSKYCIGMVKINKGLKYNRFKYQLKNINKINNHES